MIEDSVKLDKRGLHNLRQMFRIRMRTHYSYTVENIKIILKYWLIYLYIFIGLIGSIILIISVVYQDTSIHREQYVIYFATIIFIINLQFSIRYFIHPADLIHFKERKNIMLKLRKYAITHAINYHAFNWIVIIVLYSPLYFNLTNGNVITLISLFLFTLSFSLATSLILKESKQHLKDKHRKLYPYFYGALLIFLYIWFVIIFCFADELYILVGICINVFILIYSYKWGKQILMATLVGLVHSDSKNNMLSATIVDRVPDHKYHVHTMRKQPLLLKSKSRIFRSSNYKFVLLEILMKRLFRSGSYIVMMSLLYFVSIIGLFIIDELYQFGILSVITLYLSYLIHKQHIEFFNKYMLMKTYIKQGLDVKYSDLRLTLLLTLPIIALLLIVFIIIDLNIR